MDHPDRSRDDLSLSDTTRSAGSDWLLFLSKFLQQGRTIASFAPSSRFMARSILKGIDFSAARCVVELGAGTGPITAELLRRLPKSCRAIILELDPDLCTRLRERFPNAEIVEGNAAELDQILTERGIDRVDHILSGLPLPSIPEPIRDRILDLCSRLLTPEGTYRQLTVMPWIYYRLYKRYFNDVRFGFVPLNLPPGGVYYCRGWRGQ
jgi:phospholipid N-methyltransferase